MPVTVADPTVIIGLLILLFVFLGIKIVPQQQAWIIERLGKYNRTLGAGLNVTIPFVDRVAYKHTLKERAMDILAQAAITKDNVTLIMDGILYVKVVNPVDASYGVENPYYAVSQLAQTSMRSAIGKITMDTTFEDRVVLNSQIVSAINEASAAWGIQCMRYEIRDIKPPESVLKSMEMQVAAERQKRAEILESEGKMQSMINIAEGKKREVVLDSEANMEERINRAKGESEAIQLVAKATSDGIVLVGNAIEQKGGQEAAALRVAEQYVAAFSNMAKASNTLIVPANAGDSSNMIAQALAIFSSIKGKVGEYGGDVTKTK